MLISSNTKQTNLSWHNCDWRDFRKVCNSFHVTSAFRSVNEAIGSFGEQMHIEINTGKYILHDVEKEEVTDIHILELCGLNFGQFSCDRNSQTQRRLRRFILRLDFSRTLDSRCLRSCPAHR